MIGLICLLAALRVVNCLEQLPTRQEIETSINRTINEVERLVQEDPSLPRLSRNEIVDILFKITSTDMKSYEESVEKTREDYQRALMVVLPENSNDSKKDNFRKLYEKPSTEKPAQKVAENRDETSSDKSTREKNKGKEDTSDERRHYENHRQTYTEVLPGSPTQESLKLFFDNEKKVEKEPMKFSFDVESFKTTTSKASFAQGFVKNLLNDRVDPTGKPKLAVVYSTSVTQRSTTKLPETTSSRDNGFRPTMPSVKPTENILMSNQWHYNAPPSSTTTKSPRTTTPRRKIEKVTVPFLPTMMTETRKEEKSPAEIQSQPETPGSFWQMDDPRMTDENDKPSAVYVTPMASTSAEKLEKTTDRETTKTPMPMREEVQDLLASIGLRPEKTKDTVKNKFQDDHEKIFGTNFQVPKTSNVINGQISGLTSLGVESPSIISQNTFQTTPEDVKKGFNNLSPDVQLLFQRFGLQTPAKEEAKVSPEVTTLKPRVITSKTSFWNNFKPLPASRVTDDGMRDFLAKFGLGIDEPRKEKSMKTRKHTEDRKPSLIEAVPGNMKSILENIGLITRTTRLPEVTTTETTLEPNLHVFKPHETTLDDEKQRVRINKLLDTVRLVQEGKADVQAVQKAAKELLETTKTLKNGPDPLSLEEILKMYNEDLKNEIKRQQDPKDLKDMAISEIPDNTTVTSSPEVTGVDSSDSLAESSNGSSDPPVASIQSSEDSKDSGSLVDSLTTENTNAEALADSFGGTTALPDPVLPTPRKTGLYFLVDWNTFLEVGEEEKDKVNLRFQPKAGDRSRFIPVTVP